MPPFIALVLCLGFCLWLLLFDPGRGPKTSLTLWVPLLWVFIVASRLPSQWLGNQMGATSDASMEGDSLDRVIYSGLILLALSILMSRGFNWGDFFSKNFLLMGFLLFALVSVVWSDFPFVSFKRWFRDLGNYLVLLVVLSDPSPLEAMRTLLRRLLFVLVPLSILFIKYYPQYGKQYDFWNGTSVYVGVTTSKNMLGVLCLVSGIFFFWDTLMNWPDRKQPRIKWSIRVNLAFIAMTIYLLNLSNSATSRVCLILGCLIIAIANRRAVKRNPFLLKVLIPVFLCLYVILQVGFDINGQLASVVGRDPTLTGRTNIWSAVLNQHTNPLVGTGYESFWLGPRLRSVWRQTGNGINEAHNGYLETYLHLGFIGLFLLCGFLVFSYRTVCKRLEEASGFGSLTLAFWTILLFYNVTESAFHGQLMWVIFLLGVMVPPRTSRAPILPAPEPLQLDEPAPKLQETVAI